MIFIIITINEKESIGIREMQGRCVSVTLICRTMARRHRVTRIGYNNKNSYIFSIFLHLDRNAYTHV